MVEGNLAGAAVVARERLPREIWVLVGASFMIAIGFGLVAPTLPVFVRSFDVGITATSLVVSVFALARLLFAPVSGRIVTRFGELPTYTIGLLVVALTTGACAFATAYWHLLALRLVGGVGSTMFTVSALSLLIRLAPPTMRGRASGVWATGFLLGNIVGPLAGGGLLAISLRAPFLVYAAMLVLVAALTGLLLRNRTTQTAAAVAAAGPPARFRDALGHPTYRAALVASFANGWAVFGVRVAIVPLFVVEALGQSEEWSGIALAVFAAGNAVTLVLGGRLADRIGRRPPTIVGLAVTAVSTAGIGFVAHPAVFLVLSVFAGLGGGLVNPPVNATVGDVVGPHARGGTVVAGFQMAADLGLVLGPLIAGALAETAGYGAAFAVTGAIAAVALLMWIRAPETLEPTPNSTEPRGPAAGSNPVDDCGATRCSGP